MPETHLRKKIDVTDKVVGKFNGGQMMLYVNRRVIGTMNLDNQVARIDFKDGYGLQEDGQRIYQIQEEGVKKDYYVEGCDLGWC